MTFLSALPSTTTNIAILILVVVKSSPAIPFEAVQQADYGSWSGVELSANDTVYTPPVDWIVKNKSSIKTGLDDAGAPDDYFDDPRRKPPGGFGVAGDMLYMLPLFTLMDRLNEASFSVPTISWPLKKAEEKSEVSQDERVSGSDSPPESNSGSLLPPAKLSMQSDDEQTPPEGNDGHIHIGQGKNCPAPGCNNGLCRCPECETMLTQTAGQKRRLETASDAISAKKEKLSTADELLPEVTENTEQAHEQGSTRSNSLAGTSTNIVHALSRRQATGAPLSRLLDQALYSQYLLQAIAPIQPVAVLNDEAEFEQWVVLCNTRIITWGFEPYFRVWSEQECGWSATEVPIARSRLQAIVPVACNRFFTCTEDGSLRLWTEMQGEWTDLEITSQAGIPRTLLVLSGGQLVASSDRRLVVWTEVSGIWSSTELEIGSETITKLLALREGGFLMLSREKPYFKVTLWFREESGWTHEIYCQSTGLRLESAEVKGIDGYAIEDVSELDDGRILLLVGSVGPCYDNSGVVGQYRRFIWTGRNRRWAGFSRWRASSDDYREEYKFLTGGQIITWKSAGFCSGKYVVSLRTEQPDGEWQASEVIQDDSRMFQVRHFLQLRDARLVIITGSIYKPTLKILIYDNRKWSSVDFAHFDGFEGPLEMAEIRAGLLATRHVDGRIRLWDLYHPFQCAYDQGAFD